MVAVRLPQRTTVTANPADQADNDPRRRQVVIPRSRSAVRAKDDPSRCKFSVERINHQPAAWMRNFPPNRLVTNMSTIVVNRIARLRAQQFEMDQTPSANRRWKQKRNFRFRKRREPPVRAAIPMRAPLPSGTLPLRSFSKSAWLTRMRARVTPVRCRIRWAGRTGIEEIKIKIERAHNRANEVLGLLEPLEPHQRCDFHRVVL